MSNPPRVESLPIDAVLPGLIEVLDHDGADRPRAAVLVAPTGAGKTTRVPPGLQGVVRGRIVMTEPRRVAARAAARRIASEQRHRLGDETGYTVRFESRTSRNTRIEVVTEGILVRRIQSDPFLEGIGALVFDEFHERSLDADLALALARQVQREARPDLAIVVMSATLDADPIAAWLGEVPVVRSEGRSYPVELHYPPRADERPLEAQAAAAVRAALESGDGDILVFLPGVGEIRRTEALLEDLAGKGGVGLHALHGRLEAEAQDAVIAPSARRKVVLATNVAESSLTIPGVDTVIDTGWARVNRYDPGAGLDRLVLERISLDSAAQRAGRAGRERPGRCFRLWPSAVEYRMAPHLDAEIHRVDLAGVALQLMAWGEADPRAFGWLEAPDEARWDDAQELLERLGCARDGRITARGERLSKLPLHPRLGRLLEEGVRLGVAADAAAAAAALSERDPVRYPARDAAPARDSDSDLADRAELIVSNGRQPRALVARVDPGALASCRRNAQQLERLACDFGVEGSDEERRTRLLRAVLAAFPDRVARRRDGDPSRAVMVGRQGLQLGNETALRDNVELFVCLDAAPPERGRADDARVRMASRVERDWLPVELTSDLILVEFDREREQVGAARVQAYIDLVLSRVPAPLPARGVEPILADAAGEALQRALPLDEPAFDRLRSRLEWLRQARPDLELPGLDDDALREMLPDLCVGKRSFAELRRVDLATYVRSRLPWVTWRTLDELAPDAIDVPSGRTARLRYEPGSPPVLAARIQELFGMADTPRVAGGRVPVVVHLLAPNMRPQQITSDLGSFWRDGYAQVRRELRARYPKHSWPEDPTTATAERKPGGGRRS